MPHIAGNLSEHDRFQAYTVEASRVSLIGVTRRTLSAGDIDDLLKQCAELLALAIETGHVGGEAPLVVEMSPGDAMARLSGELAKKCTQAACVALPERMDRVHLGVVVRQPRQEGGAIEALEAGLPSKLGEDALRVASDALRAGVEGVWLCDLDGAQLPRPRIERPEDATVKRLPMR